MLQGTLTWFLNSFKNLGKKNANLVGISLNFLHNISTCIRKFFLLSIFDKFDQSSCI
uniref:Uncharacterized protein n=1 Tax=Amphimedon queenslandica TaxID=400682 RepID=A0A1X7V0Z0_AMPQE